MEPDHPSRISQDGGHFRNGKCGSVGSEHHVGSADPFQLLPDTLFNVHIFQYGFDNQIHVFQVFQRSGRGHFGFDHGVHIFLCHLPFFDRVIKGLPDRRHAFLYGVVVDVPKHSLNARFHQQVDDPRTHDPASQHGNLRDFRRFQSLDPGKFACSPGVQENADQVFGHIGYGAIGKKPDLSFNIGFYVKSKTLLKGIYGLERRDIPFPFLHGHEPGVIDHCGFFSSAGQPIIDVPCHVKLKVELA